MSVNPFNHQYISEQLSGPTNQWLQKLVVYEEITSTNADLMSLAAVESVDGYLFVTTNQTQGRGRHGRQWIAPRDQALAMSLGFVSQRQAAQLHGLSLVVGLALLDALESLGVSDLALKWPNDLLHKGAKLAGILVETSRCGKELTLVVGLGINLSGAKQLSAQLDRQIADLSQFEASQDLSRLVARITNSVVTYLQGFAKLGFSPLREQWQKRHAFQNRKLVIQQGEQQIAGLCLGVSEQGELLLQTATGLEKVSAGEVHID